MLDLVLGLSSEPVVADLHGAVDLAVLLAHVASLDFLLGLTGEPVVVDLESLILLAHITDLDLLLRLSQQPVVAEQQVQPVIVEPEAAILHRDGGHGHRLGMHRCDAVQTRDRQHQSARETAESDPAPPATMTR